uniref:TTF-type domain-containing protein n=1 Tax=Timema tahoe TaxID=61484 RepID=A0A7R9ISX0_9NEOP|nr:unnamed protein product [Timema tahoe]
MSRWKSSLLWYETASINYGLYRPNCDYKTLNVQGKFRSFKESWYSDFAWLEYRAIKYSGFSYSCRLFCQQKSGNGKVSLMTEGMANWKKALEKFRKHEKSEMNLKSMQFLTLGNTVADKLSSVRSIQGQENSIGKYFVSGKQCLALRRHNESASSATKGHFLNLLSS